MIEDDVIDRLDKRDALKALTESAKQHTNAAFAYSDAKVALAQAVQQARRSGMQITTIAELTDLSRPTVYKLLRHQAGEGFVRHLLGSRYEE